MKTNMKSGLSVILAAMLLVSMAFVPAVSAQETLIQVEKNTEEKAFCLDIANNDTQIIVVEDEKELLRLAEIHNADAPEGYKLSKIEFVLNLQNETNDEAVEKFETSSTDVQQRSVVLNRYIKDVRTVSNNCYFPNDPYRNDWFDGPDTATIQETHSFDATLSSQLGVGINDIEASVGFSLTQGYQILIQSTTPVPADKRLNVKTYAVYQIKEFDVWDNNLFEDDTFYATGTACKPVGTYFAKYWYDLN